MEQKSITVQTPPDLVGKPEVDFIKSDFEALIEQKGYDVYHDRGVKCPCSSPDGGASLTSCRNCSGSGWIYINRKKTRIVLQSMNIDTKYKQWSEERLGAVKITARDVDRLAIMDRLTLLDGEAVYNQILFLKTQPSSSELYGTTRYDVLSIQDIFLFDTQTTNLIKLEPTTDYTFTRNQIKLTASWNSHPNPTLSVRYIHRPEFTVIDLPRDIIVSTIRDEKTGESKDVQFPISAIGRRSHYMPDRGNFDDSNLLDNSYTE